MSEKTARLTWVWHIDFSENCPTKRRKLPGFEGHFSYESFAALLYPSGKLSRRADGAAAPSLSRGPWSLACEPPPRVPSQEPHAFKALLFLQILRPKPPKSAVLTRRQAEPDGSEALLKPHF